MADLDLNGKIVVVTGASGRLGQRVVAGFARDGAVIVALVRDEDEARRIPFPDDAEGWAFPVDVTNETQVEACFEQIERQFGRVDVLVHTVGGWEERALLETKWDDWDNVLRLNLGSTLLCFREAARLMKGQGGRLIALAAGQGADKGVARQAGYAAAKAGVIRLVESAAAELREHGITAHAIAPSTILYDDGGEAKGVAAGEIVDLCRYLASSAGDALNGATVRAYGTA